MVAAVAPYIDTSISKTVNVPEDYPYGEFEDLYLTAWRAGLKGLATYRPNSVLGSVLSVDTPKTEEKKQPHDVEIITGTNQRGQENIRASATILCGSRAHGELKLPPTPPLPA